MVKDQPITWTVQHHPALDAKIGLTDSQGMFMKDLRTFQPWSHGASPIRRRAPQTLVAIGSQVAYSFWTVASVEHLATGEFLVTLRARASLGALPEINRERLPANGAADDLGDVRP